MNDSMGYFGIYYRPMVPRYVDEIDKLSYDIFPTGVIPNSMLPKPEKSDHKN